MEKFIFSATIRNNSDKEKNVYLFDEDDELVGTSFEGLTSNWLTNIETVEKLFANKNKAYIIEKFVRQVYEGENKNISRATTSFIYPVTPAKEVVCVSFVSPYFFQSGMTEHLGKILLYRDVKAKVTVPAKTSIIITFFVATSVTSDNVADFWKALDEFKTKEEKETAMVPVIYDRLENMERWQKQLDEKIDKLFNELNKPL